MATIKIGGHERPLADFSAAKALEAGALVSAIIQKGGGIVAAMDDFAAGRVQAGTLTLSRAAMHYRDPEGTAQIPDQAWEASGNVFELPGARPTFEETLIGVWPQVFAVARDEVFQLLALVLVDERRLEEADRSGPDGIAALLHDEAMNLRHKARMEEVFALAVAAWEHCQTQFRGDPTALALIDRLKRLRSQQTSPDTSPEPASSTGSPTRTGGPAKKSSTGSRSRSSKPSAVS